MQTHPAGRLCRAVSRCVGIEGGRRTAAPSTGAIEPIRGQSRRTGPPASQTPDPADVGFKLFDNAAVTISGIEFAEKTKKSQFKTGKLRNRKSIKSKLWNPALAAGTFGVFNAAGPAYVHLDPSLH